MTEKEFLKKYNIHDYEIPLCTVDMAIFAIIDEALHLLIVKRLDHPEKNKWALPGGFINLTSDASLDAAAYRKLIEKTGINSPYLEQVSTSGSATRDPRGWSLTVLYFALIDITKVDASRLTANSRWLKVTDLNTTSLAFDHEKLTTQALSRLRSKATYSALPIELMPSEFTLTELQNVFSIILERELPIKSFRRRLMDADMVEETGNSKIAGKRPAKLYRSTGKDRTEVLPHAIRP